MIVIFSKTETDIYFTKKVTIYTKTLVMRLFYEVYYRHYQFYYKYPHSGIMGSKISVIVVDE